MFKELILSRFGILKQAKQTQGRGEKMEELIITLSTSLLIAVGISLGIAVPIIQGRKKKRVKRAVTAVRGW
jgi:hypothetical protein